MDNSQLGCTVILGVKTTLRRMGRELLKVTVQFNHFSREDKEKERKQYSNCLNLSFFEPILL